MNAKTLEKVKKDRYLPGPGIVNKYWIKGTLKTKSPLHIGTGEQGRSWKEGAGDGKNCNYVLLSSKPADQVKPSRDKAAEPPHAANRDSGNHGAPCAFPVLPGSSLRGVLRSWLESVLYPFNSPGEYDVASLSATQFDFERGITRSVFDDELADCRKRAAKNHPPNTVQHDRQVEGCLAEFLCREADLVGFLFGSTLVRGRVAFGNGVARQMEKDRRVLVRDEVFAIRTGVSIDRDTGAAADEKLFDIEVVQPRVDFPVELRFTNVRYWEIGLVLAALEVFNHRTFPLQMGAHTQQGFGRMAWTLQTVRQLGHDAASDKPVLSDWLAHLGPAVAASRLDIGRRGIAGVTDAASFRDHCVAELQQVLDAVCRRADTQKTAVDHVCA